MKVTELKTFVVGNPPPHKGGRYFIFVKLTTDNGISGIGEVYNATFSPSVISNMINDIFAAHIENTDPFRIETLWRNVYARGYSSRPDISLVSVLSGLEIALWDIIGKSVDKPVYELLGGRVHERLRTYTYLYPAADGDANSADPVYSDPAVAAERAIEYVKRGFTAVKFDPAGQYTTFDPHQPELESIARSKLFVDTLRDALGNTADLLFGTHGQFTTAGAIRMAKALETANPLWFEEPVPPEMPEQMARVARQTSIPIATGERLTTKYEFSRVLQCDAAAILQPALGRVGGLLEAKKIASMAETYYAQLAPHLYCGPVEAAANIQLAACSPNFLILESIENWSGFHEQLLSKPLNWQDGFAIPSPEPGLGIELNEQVALAHPYDGNELHITPGTAPIT
jgi:2-dehydro-3-deoxyphosphogalactonate aldolase